MEQTLAKKYLHIGYREDGGQIYSLVVAKYGNNRVSIWQIPIGFARGLRSTVRVWKDMSVEAVDQHLGTVFTDLDLNVRCDAGDVMRRADTIK
jgi:hypothetical protein